MQKRKSMFTGFLSLCLVLLLSFALPLQTWAEAYQSVGVLTDDPDMDVFEVVDMLRHLPKIKEIIANLNMLSAEEVQALLDAETITTPIFAQIDELKAQENAVREKIREKHKDVYDAYDAIYDKTKYLWKKIYAEATANSPLGDSIAMIQQSSLSEEEKKILLDAEAELEAIDEALMQADDEMAEAASPLSDQISELETSLNPLREKLLDIFMKMEQSEYYMNQVYGP